MKELIDVRRYKEALDLFDRPSQAPNDYSLNLALKACTKLGLRQRGIKIHQELSSKSLQNPFIQVSLIHFYMQCKDVDRAEEIFSVTDQHSLVSINTMMKGYISNGMSSKALHLFRRNPIQPSQMTLMILFNACAKAADAQAKTIGRTLLGQLVDQMLDDEKLITSAIDMLMKFGDVEHAERLFHAMKKRSIVSYGAMMQGYVINDLSEKALDLFEDLNMEPNANIYAILYSACASLCNDRAVRLAKKSLEHMPKIFLDDIVLTGSVLQMLMKFGEVEEATRLFSRINKCDMNTYGIMLNGYNLNRQPSRSLKLFERLQKQQKIIVNEPIAVALAVACSQIAVLPVCERIVKSIPAHLANNNRQVRNVLIDMWVRISPLLSAFDFVVFTSG
jgi:pentatricopeptide repeat protein